MIIKMQNLRKLIGMIAVFTISILPLVSLTSGQVYAYDDPDTANADKIKKLDAKIELLKKQIEKLEQEAKLRALEKEINDANTPQDTSAASIDKQTEIIKKKTDQVEAEKKLLRAYLPSSTTAALSGDIKADANAILEGEIMSYKAMAQITEAIGKDIGESKVPAGKVMIYNERDISLLQNYISTMSQIEQLIEKYKELKAKPTQQSDTPESAESAVAALMAPEMASQVLKSFADLLALFRTDVDIKGQAVTIDENALISHIASSLKKSGSDWTVFHPALLPPAMLTLDSKDKLRIVDKLGELNKVKAEAQGIVTTYESQSKEEQSKNVYRSKINSMKIYNERIDKFMETLLQIDDKTRDSGYMSLIRAEKLRSTLSLDNNSSYVLFIKVVKAGANIKTTKNLFTGSKISHSGGAIITYILFKTDGTIASSKTLNAYDGYVDIKSRKEKLSN